MAKKVKLYSTSTCTYCKMEKDFLKEHKIEFEDIDVGEHGGRDISTFAVLRGCRRRPDARVARLLSPHPRATP